MTGFLTLRGSGRIAFAVRSFERNVAPVSAQGKCFFHLSLAAGARRDSAVSG
jgi:hypothetical protein